MTLRVLLSLVVLCWTVVSKPGEPGRVIEFVPAAWDYNAERIETVVLAGPEEDPAVLLTLQQLGDRWSTTFSTEAPATWRLALEWEPGPEGLLIEIMLDGEPLPPLRDAWRPTPRRLSADLGPRWLGRGEHLIEFVAREERHDGALRLRRLQLESP